MDYFSPLTTFSRIHPAVLIVALYSEGTDPIFPQDPPYRWSVAFSVPFLTLSACVSQPEPMQLEAGVTVREIVRLVAEMDRHCDGVKVLNDFIACWCDNEGGRIPQLGPGDPLEGGPLPDPWVAREAQAVGAVVFASFASCLSEGDLQTAMFEGAQQLAQVAFCP